MPVLSSQQISDISTRILVAAGASETNGRTVGDHLADANLTGHDSHGFIRVPQYVEDIQTGIRKPDAEPEIVAESGGILRVDGHHSFGQVVGKFATEAAIEKAKGPRYQPRNYVQPRPCRPDRQLLGDGGAQRHGGHHVHWAAGRGIEHRAAVWWRRPPFQHEPNQHRLPIQGGEPGPARFRDFDWWRKANCVSTGRAGMTCPTNGSSIRTAIQAGTPTISTQAAPYFRSAERRSGHKGYALAFMAAVLGGLVGEYGKPDPTGAAYSSGSTIIVIDVSRLVPLDGIRERVDWLAGYAKDTPLMPGFDEILYPGEKEATTRRARKESGVEIEEATWGQINGLMEEYGLN